MHECALEGRFRTKEDALFDQFSSKFKPERVLANPDDDMMLFWVELCRKALVPAAGISNWKVPLDTRSDSSKFNMALSGLTAEIPVSEF